MRIRSCFLSRLRRVDGSSFEDSASVDGEAPRPWNGVLYPVPSDAGSAGKLDIAPLLMGDVKGGGGGGGDKGNDAGLSAPNPSPLETTNSLDAWIILSASACTIDLEASTSKGADIVAISEARC